MVTLSGTNSCPPVVKRLLAAGTSKRLEQALEPLRGTMKALARGDIFDLDDPGAPMAQGIDSVDTISAATNEPRRNGLSHDYLR